MGVDGGRLGSIVVDWGQLGSMGSFGFEGLKYGSIGVDRGRLGSLEVDEG
jgi:hypothetical protein